MAVRDGRDRIDADHYRRARQKLDPSVMCSFCNKRSALV
jgi:hypothetical protein